MKKTFKLFLSLLIMTVVFLGVSSKVNAVDIPKQVKTTGYSPIGNEYGYYGINHLVMLKSIEWLL